MYYKPILPLLLINIMLYYRILQRKNMEILHISKCLILKNSLQQFASKHKPQTFSRVCLRLKRDVYRWKRNVSLLM